MPHRNRNNTEPGASVSSIADARERRRTEAPPTTEEIREWREIRPLVLQMLLDWQEFGDRVKRAMPEWERVRTACPLAAKILKGE